MGGAVSSGYNNDELVDNLLEADYIKTSRIERVFRAVDRAEYFLPEGRSNAYNDLAWKCGNLHLSAPCIYSEVMEGLRLQTGLSFLNLGSGTGYLSTMVGLILGSNGINHGVELHKDVVQYANKKLEEFKKHSGAVDEFDFCEPKFIQGNCLCLPSDCALYDRVYCGAACPEQYETYIKNLLKVDGILVMPLNDQLLQITRTSETNWEVHCLLPVSFATLVCPAGNEEQVQPIDIEPMPLQAICRAVIRNILRKNIELEHPPSKPPPPVKNFKRKRVLKKLMVPLFESDGSSEDEIYFRFGDDRNRNAGRATFRGESDRLINFFLGTIRSNPSPQDGSNRSDRNSTTEAMETDTNNESTDENNDKQNATSVETEVTAVIEHNPNNSNTQQRQQQQQSQSNNSTRNQDPLVSFCNDILDLEEFENDVLNVLRSENQRDNTEEKQQSTTNEQEEENSEDEPLPGNSRIMNRESMKKKTKREKFDSGLGDEIPSASESDNEDLSFVRKMISSSDDDDDDDEEEDADEDDGDKQSKRQYKSRRDNKSVLLHKPIIKMRKIGNYAITTDSSSDNENRDDEHKIDNNSKPEMRMYESVYTEFMKAKIQELPLPPILKRYLNFYREF